MHKQKPLDGGSLSRGLVRSGEMRESGQTPWKYGVPNHLLMIKRARCSGKIRWLLPIIPTGFINLFVVKWGYSE